MEVFVDELERVGYIYIEKEGKRVMILASDWDKDEKTHKKVHEKLKKTRAS